MVEFFAYNGLINAVLAALVVYYILAYHRDEEITGISLFLVLSVGFWSFGYWRWLTSATSAEALGNARILSVGATLIPVAFLHWTLIFLRRTYEHKNLIRCSYIISGFLLAFGFSKWFVASVAPIGPFPFWPQAGPLYGLYIIVSYFGFIGYGLLLLWRRYKSEGGLMHARLRYIVIGLAVCALGGSTNFLPWYGIPVPPFGNIATIAFALVLAYAVTHYRNHISSMRLLGRM